MDAFARTAPPVLTVICSNYRLHAPLLGCQLVKSSIQFMHFSPQQQLVTSRPGSMTLRDGQKSSNTLNFPHSAGHHLSFESSIPIGSRHACLSPLSYYLEQRSLPASRTTSPNHSHRGAATEIPASFCLERAIHATTSITLQRFPL